MAALGCVLAAASLVVSVSLYKKINDERERNLAITCIRDSDQNARIIDYLTALGVEPNSIDRARRFFPVLTDEQCADQAARRVGPP